MTRCLLALALLLSCKSPAVEEPVVDPEAKLEPWSDARTRRLNAVSTGGGELVLELVHKPSGRTPELSLQLVGKDSTQLLWTQVVPLTLRDRLWKAELALATEPAGERLALTSDGGKTFHPIFKKGLAAPLLCPHLTFPGISGAPDWSRFPTIELWAAGALETAVWGCDPKGRRCKSRSLANLAVHHSEPGGEELLPRFHDEELAAALPFVEDTTLDRRLAIALVDGAVTYQQGLDAAGLERLGRAAARALSHGSPLSLEERRALQLRAMMAKDEAKKRPKEQLSPRESIAALLAGVK